jgi:hypothetical protein
MLNMSDLFEEGNFSPHYGYLYITIFDNVSITVSIQSSLHCLYCKVSMYYLVLFYMATKQELQPLKPVPKFLCIKAVIFFSFWQSIVVAGIQKIGVIHDVRT